MRTANSERQLLVGVQVAVTALLFFGCVGCTHDTVTLYAIGDVKRTVPISRGSSIEQRKLAKALQLYEKEEYEVARRMAESLFDGSCDVEARELSAVAETRNGNACVGECGLREAIRLHPDSPNLRKALVWQLAEHGRYASAEREAYDAARTSDDLELWDYLVAVRTEHGKAVRRAFALWSAVWCLVVVVIAGLSFALGRKID